MLVLITDDNLKVSTVQSSGFNLNDELVLILAFTHFIMISVRSIVI